MQHLMRHLVHDLPRRDVQARLMSEMRHQTQPIAPDPVARPRCVHLMQPPSADVHPVRHVRQQRYDAASSAGGRSRGRRPMCI
jgi:hypothetical protein